MQESNERFLHKNTCNSLSPYVGIIQIRFRVKASAYSQPAIRAPLVFNNSFIIHVHKGNASILLNPKQLTIISLLKSCLIFYPLPMHMQIFFLRGKSSPDMAFGLINIQHLACFCRQHMVDLAETFCDVLMYRTLADSEMLCSLSHRSIIFNNILRYLCCPFFNITFQKSPLQYLFLHCMQGIFFHDLNYNSSILVRQGFPAATPPPYGTSQP